MAGFTLESFDDDTSGPRQIQSAEYQKGLEDGVARAQLESTAQQAKALSDISASDMVSVLSDAGLGFEPVPDPTLTLGQARLQGGGTHIMIDLPSLVSDLQKALLGLDSTQRNQAHG